MRFDVYCARRFNISRHNAQQQIKMGKITVNNEIIRKYNYNYNENQDIQWNKEKKLMADILYENDNLYVVYKPSGMVVERTITTPNYDHVLMEQFDNVYGLVNRLDKPTCGIMILPKSSIMYYNLKQQFRNYTMKKQYYAYFKNYDFTIKNYVFEHFICSHNYEYFGFNLNNNCFCDLNNLNLNCYESFVESNKYTKTYYEKYDNYYKCYPITGRTHQIRLMMDDLNVPIITINEKTIGLISMVISYKIYV